MNSIGSKLISQSNASVLQRDGVSAHVYDLIYQSGAPWEIGAPQPVVIDLRRSGRITGRVLDIGCGFGENAYFLASQGHEVVAIDFVERVIARANSAPKSARGNVRFECRDLFSLSPADGTFDTILDSATFHGFSDADRRRYASTLRKVSHPGTRLFVLGISDKEIRQGGPRRLSENVVRDTFTGDWRVLECTPVTYVAEVFPGGARAMLAVMERV